MMMTTTNVAGTGTVTDATRRTGLEVMWLLEKLIGRDQVRRDPTMVIEINDLVSYVRLKLLKCLF
ncbi:hypothetical protein N665_0152s0022 [Sinapis alba]|nr:hypothetical protein N665_0152s0022 [Sinapis alba]